MTLQKGIERIFQYRHPTLPNAFAKDFIKNIFPPADHILT